MLLSIFNCKTNFDINLTRTYPAKEFIANENNSFKQYRVEVDKYSKLIGEMKKTVNKFNSLSSSFSILFSLLYVYIYIYIYIYILFLRRRFTSMLP